MESGPPFRILSSSGGISIGGCKGALSIFFSLFKSFIAGKRKREYKESSAGPAGALALDGTAAIVDHSE